MFQLILSPTNALLAHEDMHILLLPAWELQLIYCSRSDSDMQLFTASARLHKQGGPPSNFPLSDRPKIPLQTEHTITNLHHQ